MSTPKAPLTQVAIHLPKHQLGQGEPQINGFYGKLATQFRAAGTSVEFRQRDSIVADPMVFEDGVLHFVHQGVVKQANCLNTGIAYIPAFWYVDPSGVFGDSSVAGKKFRPETIDVTKARAFATRLRNRYIVARKSKYEQPETAVACPTGAISVFLQGRSLPVQRAQFVSELEMVRDVLQGAGDKPVLLKPHPRNPDSGVMEHATQLQAHYPNLQIVEANVHDMIANSMLCVSISSSVMVEAMMHGVPSVAYGQTDFHHAVQTAEHLGQFGDYAEMALNRKMGYAKYLFWFLQRQQVNIGHDRWWHKIQNRARKVGWVGPT